MSRAMIISPPAGNTALIEQIIRAEGFTRISVISSGSEARRLLKNGSEPELIVINAPLPDEFGQELAESAAAETSAAIIIVCLSDIADDIADKVSQSGISVVSKPISRQLLSRTVRLVTADRSRMLGIYRENSELMTKIDDMRLINRAKSTLMKYLKFTEQQAHKYIEKQAMNTRQTKREVAIRILSTYES
ncbi:MAG: ANTAR domain-containing protein [Ruminococcus sp.]|nr:ANTAR domain-containing protein [Ruminococcus sp.]